jgi:hypothetical protein
MTEEVIVKSNGHKQDSDIVKEKKKILKASSAAGAFHSPQGSGNLSDHFVVPGDEPREVLMRTIYTKNRSEASIMSIATARDLADCEEFEDYQDKEELLGVVAGDASINGRSTELLRDSIIGDKQMRSHSDFFDKMKGWYGSTPDKGGKE